MTFTMQILAALLWIIAVLMAAGVRKRNVIATTQKGADEALKHIGEWSKWMAGIQTTAIAGLAFLVMDEDGAGVHPLPAPAGFFALAGFGLLGIALYFNAWVMSSLPSQAIRVHAELPGNQALASFDVYEQPLFGWSTRVRLGYVLNAKHWLWGHGLLAVALFVLTLMYCGQAQC